MVERTSQPQRGGAILKPRRVQTVVLAVLGSFLLASCRGDSGPAGAPSAATEATVAETGALARCNATEARACNATSVTPEGILEISTAVDACRASSRPGCGWMHVKFDDTGCAIGIEFQHQDIDPGLAACIRSSVVGLRWSCAAGTDRVRHLISSCTVL